MLQDGVVAEVVLVRSLDAEGPLSSHASHRLAHVERPDVLDLGQTDVQRTKGSCTGVRRRTVRGERLEEEPQDKESFPWNTRQRWSSPGPEGGPGGTTFGSSNTNPTQIKKKMLAYFPSSLEKKNH